MKPLIVLLLAFVVVLLLAHLIQGGWNFPLAGNSAMAVMLLFTALGHFLYNKGMALMIPDFFPAKKEIVLLTGMWEVCFAAGLLVPETRHVVAILLVIFLLLVLPANINAALKRIDYKKATYEGSGVEYLWLRVPLQAFFIAWVIWFAIIGPQ